MLGVNDCKRVIACFVGFTEQSVVPRGRICIDDKWVRTYQFVLGCASSVPPWKNQKGDKNVCVRPTKMIRYVGYTETNHLLSWVSRHERHESWMQFFSFLQKNEANGVFGFQNGTIKLAAIPGVSSLYSSTKVTDCTAWKNSVRPD